MTRGGVSEETRTYWEKREYTCVLGKKNRVRVTGHLHATISPVPAKN